jgi:Protein of unknown function (DUF3667)
MKNCKNCNTKHNDKFCKNCGQKAAVGELTLHDVYHETWHAITHTDSGILKLTKDLFIRPKTVYLNYFSGQRKKYFSPVTFFLIMAGILLFVGTKIFDYEDYQLKTLNEYGRYAFYDTKIRALMLLPIEILCTWALSYRQFNLAKNIVFWLYLNGLAFTLQLAFTPVYFLFISHKSTIDSIVTGLTYGLFLWHLISLFGDRKIGKILLLILFNHFLIMLNYFIAAYRLFGDQMLKATDSKSYFDMILHSLSIF